MNGISLRDIVEALDGEVKRSRARALLHEDKLLAMACMKSANALEEAKRIVLSSKQRDGLE